MALENDSNRIFLLIHFAADSSLFRRTLLYAYFAKHTQIMTFLCFVITRGGGCDVILKRSLAASSVDIFEEHIVYYCIILSVNNTE